MNKELRPNPIEFIADTRKLTGRRAFFLFGDGRGNSDHALDGAVYEDGEHLTIFWADIPPCLKDSVLDGMLKGMNSLAVNIAAVSKVALEHAEHHKHE